MWARVCARVFEREREKWKGEEKCEYRIERGRLLYARTSTKPPKGHRRRNSQSRSSVPCVLERKEKKMSSKVSFFVLFFFAKFPGGEKLCRCRRELCVDENARASSYLFSLSTFSSFSSFPSFAFFSISVTFRPDFRGSTFSLDVSQDGGGFWRFWCSKAIVLSSSPVNTPRETTTTKNSFRKKWYIISVVLEGEEGGVLSFSSQKRWYVGSVALQVRSEMMTSFPFFFFFFFFIFRVLF